MDLSRRDFLKGSGGAGALLLMPPLLRNRGLFAPLGPTLGAQDNYGTARESRLFPGTRVVHADLHNHTLLSDGDGEASEAYLSMRSAGLDVAALTDHTTLNWGLPSSPCVAFGPFEKDCQSLMGINDASWEQTRAYAEAATSDEFLAIRGFEWSSPSLGHMNVWFSENYTDPLHTGGAGRGNHAGDFLHDESDGDFPQELAEQIDALIATGNVGEGMRLFYEWLKLEPSDGVGGLDGIAGFNHPGREVGRFQDFWYDAALQERLVSLEVFNRREDYLFEAVDRGRPSPINECLNAGWRPGLLGVTDEHGTEWGFEEGKGRGGLWVDDLGPDGVKQAMLQRRFFATNILGLRLDARASSLASGEEARMGSALAHDSGTVRIELDLARGAVTPPAGFSDPGDDWTGRTVGVQVCRPGDQLPSIATATTAVVPGEEDELITVELEVDRADGDWLFVRLTDPDQGADGRAAGTDYTGLGKAIAYTSPFYLDAAS